MLSVRRLILILLFVCGFVTARAQTPDEQYVRIYQMIQDGDRLNEAGNSRAAAAKYLEAQESLRKFQGIYRGWNERVVNYRLNYLERKLTPLSAHFTGTPAATSAASVTASNPPPAAPATPAPAVPETPATPAPATTSAVTAAPTPAPVPQPSSELRQQLASLQVEVERLRNENNRLASDNTRLAGDNNRLGAEVNRLGAKLKEALSVQPAAVDPRELVKAQERIRSLEKENDLIQVRLQLATNKAAELASASDSVADLKTKLAEQAEAVAALRAENEILKKREKEMAIKAASAPASAITAQPPEVAAADREQLETLKARLSALAAKPLPFTQEELALMSEPAPTTSANAFAASTTGTSAQPTPPPAEGAPKKASRELPPGAGPLVAAAVRAFTAKDFVEAEKKYSEVLRQDENNVGILANLASSQLEQGKTAEAENTVKKALALDPDDYFSLYVLGRLRFREDKLGEAMDAFSRSVKSNPDDADAQNYLGIVLSELGYRVPAEAALRRALQIQPNHGTAHNNLAVIYATQTPPAMALARWHYQRALQAGHPRNADLEKLLGGGK